MKPAQWEVKWSLIVALDFSLVLDPRYTTVDLCLQINKIILTNGRFLYPQWAVKVDEAFLEKEVFRYLTLIRFYLHLMLVLWYSRSPNSMVYTCNHDDLVEIIEDIDLEGSLYPRNGMRRVFPWVLERQRIETLFGTQKNQLQIRTNNVKTDKIFVGLSRNSKKLPYLPYFRKEIRQTTRCAKMTSGLVKSQCLIRDLL